MKKSFSLLGIFLILCLFSSAFNQEAEPLADIKEKDLAGKKILSVSPCALKPGAALYYRTWNFYTYPDEAYISSTQGIYTPILSAPVYLPNKAKVTEVTAYYTDNDDRTNYHMYVYLVAHNMKTGKDYYMSWINTSYVSASPNRRVLVDKTINYPKVNNSKYAYFLEVIFWEPSSNLKFHGAKIVYR